MWNSSNKFSWSLAIFNPRTYKERGGGGVDATCLPPVRFFGVFFFLEDKTLASDDFSSCLFIPRAHFETSSVMNSCYGYEI